MYQLVAVAFQSQQIQLANWSSDAGLNQLKMKWEHLIEMFI